MTLVFVPRWRARINYDCKQYSLGSFNSGQEAALAYDKEARKSGGGKMLNYPDAIEEADLFTDGAGAGGACDPLST
jgi:hypothetical protein